jgi:hypothetical protein
MARDHQQLTSLEYEYFCICNTVRDCFQYYNGYYALIVMFLSLYAVTL